MEDQKAISPQAVATMIQVARTGEFFPTIENFTKTLTTLEGDQDLSNSDQRVSGLLSVTEILVSRLIRLSSSLSSPVPASFLKDDRKQKVFLFSRALVVLLPKLPPQYQVILRKHTALLDQFISVNNISADPLLAESKNPPLPTPGLADIFSASLQLWRDAPALAQAGLQMGLELMNNNLDQQQSPFALMQAMLNPLGSQPPVPAPSAFNSASALSSQPAPASPGRAAPAPLPSMSYVAPQAFSASPAESKFKEAIASLKKEFPHGTLELTKSFLHMAGIKDFEEKRAPKLAPQKNGDLCLWTIYVTEEENAKLNKHYQENCPGLIKGFLLEKPDSKDIAGSSPQRAVVKLKIDPVKLAGIGSKLAADYTQRKAPEPATPAVTAASTP